MQLSKIFFSIALITCCYITASYNGINIPDKKNEWFVQCIQKSRSKVFVVHDKNGEVLYKVSCKEQGDRVSVYRGKRICPVIKNAEIGDERFPFCMGIASDNYDYILKWYNSIKQDTIPMVPPLIIPTASHAKIVPIKSSNQTKKSSVSKKYNISLSKGTESQKAYRIYKEGHLNLEYYTDGFCEKYTAFEGKNVLYSVTKSIKRDRDFYIDQIFKNVENYPFYRGDAQNSYGYFKFNFTHLMNVTKWTDSQSKFKLKIIERDKGFISKIVANSKGCMHRVIDRKTIINNQKTKGYVVKEAFIPGHDYGNGDSK